MGNWSNKDKESKTKLNIKKKYSQLLPQDKLDGYLPTDIYITTFSLELEQLIDILYQLDVLHLIGRDKVHIFYDKLNRIAETDNKQIISEKYLHGIVIKEGETLYSFHPKIILVRYENPSNKSIRYVVIITSKNLTNANLLDAFSVAYGDVSQESQTNGEHLSNFWKDVLKKAGISLNNPDICDELRKTNFIQPENQNVSFYGLDEILDQIKGKKKLIIVSPFLSDGMIDWINNNNCCIDKIVSTKKGYSSLSEEKIEKLIEEKKCYILSMGRQELHAKIYCWKEDNKAHWIIGSSNATNNGCNIFNSSKNIEYNIGFETEKDEYDEFSILIENSNIFTTIEIDDYKFLMETENNGFDARKFFDEFCSSIDISCKKDDSGEYMCKITYISNRGILDNECVVVKLRKPDDYEYKEFRMERGQYVCFTAKAPFPSLVVKIIKATENQDEENENSCREFCLSLYNMWSDEVRAQFDLKSRNAYIELLEHIQKQYFSGKTKKDIKLKSKSLSFSKTSTHRQSENKTYIYENLLKLSYKYEKKEELIAAMERIAELANEIIVATSEKYNKKVLDEQKNLRDAIHKI